MTAAPALAQRIGGRPDSPLYDDLAKGLEGEARRVVVGLNWTLVEGPAGTGLCHTPARGTGGCRSLPAPGHYTGRPLAELANLRRGDNVFEHALAIAAMNAHHNRYDLEAETLNGLDLVRDGDEGAHTVVVGRFPGLAKRLPKVRIVEREPRPGEYSEADAVGIIPGCRYLVVTASTFVDGAIARYLGLAQGATVIILGPGTPLAPVLFDHGATALSGFVGTDVDAAVRVLAEGGAVGALKPCGRMVTLRRGSRS